MRLGYIEVEGKKLFKTDFSNLYGKNLLDLVLLTLEEQSKITEKTNFITNVQGCKLDVECLGYLRIAGKKIQHHVEKSAIIGVNKHLLPFFKIYVTYTDSKMKVFENEEDALKYLLE